MNTPTFFYLIIFTVVLVLSKSEDPCTVPDGDACPSNPAILCDTITNKIVPCAKQKAMEIKLKERQAAQEHQENPQAPSASKYGKSSPEAQELAGPARYILTVEELIRERCKQDKLVVEALGIRLSVTNGILECHPSANRKTRQVETCLYSHNINCNNTVYRTIDGSCNNVNRSAWGKSFTPLERFLQADYADGIQEPRKSKAGSPLPSARNISVVLSQTTVRSDLSHVHTFLHVSFGQLVDHDLSETVKTQVEINGTFVDLPCGTDGCNSTGPENTACFPIEIPTGDPHFGNQTCLKFVRTQEVLQANCAPGQRQQLNRITSWLDASQVYGNTIEENEKLRDRSQKDRGMLKTTPHPRHPQTLKPFLPQRDDPSCRNINSKNGIMCFRAGDERVNDQVGLTSLHTLFLRYHNYIEGELHKLNPHWTGEKKYQEARKILVAHWQNIVFHELVPNIIGPDFVREYGLEIPAKGYRDVYNSQVNPTVSNSMATAAYRFGHSQIPGNMMMVNKDKTMVKDLPLTQVLRDPNEIYDTTGNQTASMIDLIMMGHFIQRAEITDAIFNSQITDHLFTQSPPHGPGMDLLAINIQRGRDHGLPGYNKWREFCGFNVYTSFDDMADIPETTRQKFKDLYDHVDDVDLYVAGVAETHLPGAAVGKTFSCIIAKNFQRIMRGDRFWFERPDSELGFTLEQLNEIKKATLSSVFCAAGDNMDNIQKYLLLRPREDALRSLGVGKTIDDVAKLADMYRREPNIPGGCSQIHNINLNLWRESQGNTVKQEFNGRAIDRTASYNSVTGMVNLNGKTYTADQAGIALCGLFMKIGKTSKKLSSSMNSCEVKSISSGSVIFDYVLIFNGDTPLAESEVLSEIASGLDSHPEFGLNIKVKDISLGDEGWSTMEIALMISGAVVFFILLLILFGLCYGYHANARQPMWSWGSPKYGSDPQICLVSPAQSPPPHKQSARPKFDFSRPWRPERRGDVFYNSQQSLYGQPRY